MSLLGIDLANLATYYGVLLAGIIILGLQTFLGFKHLAKESKIKKAFDSQKEEIATLNKQVTDLTAKLETTRKSYDRVVEDLSVTKGQLDFYVQVSIGHLQKISSQNSNNTNETKT